MVEVADTLEKAVEAFEKVPAEEQKTIQEHKILASILQGVKMSTSVLQQNFARHGVEKLKVQVGDEFDPNKHNALFNSPATDKVKPGHVSTIIKSGYMLKERVLRATAVGVAQKQE
jgi:molecular chaperone GrpE